MLKSNIQVPDEQRQTGAASTVRRAREIPREVQSEPLRDIQKVTAGICGGARRHTFQNVRVEDLLCREFRLCQFAQTEGDKMTNDSGVIRCYWAARALYVLLKLLRGFVTIMSPLRVILRAMGKPRSAVPFRLAM
jgi:hypothetical protein